MVKNMLVSEYLGKVRELRGNDIANSFMRELGKWDQTVDALSLRKSFYSIEVMDNILNSVVFEGAGDLG